MTLNKIKDLLNREILDISIPYSLNKLKVKALSCNSQKKAKEIWCYEQMFLIKSSYIQVFRFMKKKEFMKAWRLLERIDIEFSFLNGHFDFSNKEYNLLFIWESIKRFQKLFPYKVFFSREEIIKEKKCSVCNKVVSIRNSCGHKLGEIYNGKQCCHIITDYEFLGLAWVENPHDKYTVAILDYDYTMLESVLKQLDHPFEKWELNIIKNKQIKKEFQKLKRNDLCLCGSGLKYKKCCFKSGEDSEDSEDHFQIDFLEKTKIML